MSWSGGEYSTETSDDKTYFSAPNLIYFASSGDNGSGTGYPAISPGVVGVGGTSLTLSGGTITSETGWSGSGGGISTYESIPSYQSGVSGVVGTKRGMPDISAVADPNTGVGVCWKGKWYVFGGTSVASPMCAGLVNDAQSLPASTTAELTKFYSDPTSDFRDITSGSNGGYSCKVGYDLVTGLGSPNTTAGL